MRPEIIEAITASWNETSTDRQKALIRRYLEQYGTSDNSCPWMEFLFDQLEINEPQISFG
ncbi:MAG: hypothetical protein RBS34_12125 [Desulfofustis sp.]|jgi:hypothetical protein|nr:hypothetical protein [Desulfofustis sp.]